MPAHISSPPVRLPPAADREHVRNWRAVISSPPVRPSGILQLLCWLALLVAAVPGITGDKPNLTLANRYHDNINLADYYVSEKLDGVRAYWDGQQLRSRQGNVFAAPDWFLAALPNTPLDGELWSKRGDFAAISGIVRRTRPHPGWRRITYMIFDMPQAPGHFESRLAAMRQIATAAAVPHLQVVEQWQITNADSLQQKMAEITALGGEGLMLRRRHAPYRGGRNDDLLKLKPFADAEAVVVAHHPGKGEFTGMLGSLEVENASGLRFKIGSGFTHAERRTPPPLGAAVTYKYNGFTKNGIPRFPVFLRVRDEEPPPE